MSGFDGSDPEATLTKIYERTMPRVRGYARLLTQGHDADDIVQEVYKDVWRRLSWFDALDHSHQDATLSTITLRKVINSWRKKERDAKYESQWAELEHRRQLTRNDSVERAVVRRTQLEECVEFLQRKLSPQEHKVAVLRFGLEYTTPEIASHLGIAESTVRTCLSRIKKKVAAEFGRGTVLNGIFEQDEEKGQ